MQFSRAVRIQNACASTGTMGAGSRNRTYLETKFRIQFSLAVHIQNSCAGTGSMSAGPPATFAALSGTTLIGSATRGGAPSAPTRIPQGVPTLGAYAVAAVWSQSDIGALPAPTAADAGARWRFVNATVVPATIYAGGALVSTAVGLEAVRSARPAHA